MKPLRALIWDVDGTIAETERDGHLAAFNQVFEQAGMARRWDTALYMRLVHVTGGRERILLDMPHWPDAPASAAEREALALQLHRRKNECYATLVAEGWVRPRPGVVRLMGEARAAGWRQAICTTTSRVNADALLQRVLGDDWRDTFAALVCGEDVTRKKPDPEAYGLALARLGCSPDEALALEDSQPGLRAARGAGLRVLLSPSVLFPLPAVHDAWRVCADLDHAPAGADAPAGPVDRAWLEAQWAQAQGQG